MNYIKTLFLMTLLTVLLVLAGGAIAGEAGLILALGFALVMNVFAWWNSDRIAIRMTRSRPVSRNQAPELYEMVESLCKRADLPMPKLYITPSAQPNAFATGRNPRNSAVAVTDGLLRNLNRQEVEGVIAHELAHIRNRDTLISTVAAVLAGALTAIARIGTYGMLLGGGRGRGGGNIITALLAIIFAPLAAMLIRMAISRSREFAADRSAVRIAGSPDGLASALAKLDRASKTGRMQVNEAASHMFIVNPLSGGGMSSLFSTHPPIGVRIERLRQLSGPEKRTKLR